jgi:hypothetical protein
MFEQPRTGQELMTPQQITDICEGRDQTVAMWLDLYDHYHATRDAAGRLSIAGTLALSTSGDRYEDKLTKAFITAEPLRKADRETGKITETPARENFTTVLTQTVDRRCWRALMDQLGFDQLLDEQAREFHDGLRDAPAAFTVENCAATFGNIWGNRRELYLRGIANVFAKLDRRFRSHDGFKIGSRLIIDRALNEWGSWDRYERRDTLRDVERVFLELDGKPPVSESQSIAGLVTDAGRNRANLPTVIHGDYWRVRIFKNGNLHIWFENKDLLNAVNLLLAEYYGEVIGDGYDTTEAEDAPSFHLTPAKNFGAFFTSEEVAQKVIERAEIQPGQRILEPSAGSAALAKPARDAGANVTCVEIQPGLAHELGVLHGFADVIEGDFLALNPADFASFDRVVMNPPFDRGRDCDHVRHAYQFLKPGGVLVAIMSAARVCRGQAPPGLAPDCREGRPGLPLGPQRQVVRPALRFVRPRWNQREHGYSCHPQARIGERRTRVFPFPRAPIPEIEAAEPPRRLWRSGACSGPCRKGQAVSARSALRLVVAGFPRPSFATLRAGRAIPPRDQPILAAFPTHFASGQKSMVPIAFGSIRRTRETSTCTISRK